MEERIYNTGKPRIHGIASKIMVIGVGGAGGNTVDHIYSMGIEGVNLAVCNTDIIALNKSNASYKICLGDGSGAGNTPEVARDKANAASAEIRDLLETNGTKMLFITAGMGAGTGTGAAPVIANIAKDAGILTVAIVTTPDPVEGPRRIQQAQDGIDRLRENVDSLIVLSNRTLAHISGDKPLDKAFGEANNIVAFAAKAIAEIVTVQGEIGELRVGVDLADVISVMKNSGCAVMNIASAEGDNRAVDAVERLLNSQMFGNTKIKGAKDVLLNFAVSSLDNLTPNIIRTAMKRVQDYAVTTDKEGKQQKANIIWGTSIKPELGDKLELTIIVTGFPNNYYNNLYEDDWAEELDNASAAGRRGPLPNIAPILDHDKTIPNINPHRLSHVDEYKREPAYITRKVKMLVTDKAVKHSAPRRDEGAPEGGAAAGEAPQVRHVEMDFGSDR